VPCAKLTTPNSLAQKVANASAKGAQYESQGQAPNNVRCVAPGKSTMTLEALKERNNLTLIFRTFSARFKINPCNQGRRVPLRFTLAPGFHIPRLWRWHYRLFVQSQPRLLNT
jgi:hypothetical protein